MHSEHILKGDGSDTRRAALRDGGRGGQVYIASWLPLSNCQPLVCLDRREATQTGFVSQSDESDISTDFLIQQGERMAIALLRELALDPYRPLCRY